MSHNKSIKERRISAKKSCRAVPGIEFACKKKLDFPVEVKTPENPTKVRKREFYSTMKQIFEENPNETLSDFLQFAEEIHSKLKLPK